MISKTFYTKDRLMSLFTGGKLSHYPIKDRIKVIDFEEHTVSVGETFYSIARDIFGEGGEYHWTIISDINGGRKPDDLQLGEIIKIPKTIIAETSNRLPTYEQNTSISTKV